MRERNIGKSRKQGTDVRMYSEFRAQESRSAEPHDEPQQAVSLEALT